MTAHFAYSGEVRVLGFARVFLDWKTALEFTSGGKKYSRVKKLHRAAGAYFTAVPSHQRQRI